MVNGFVYACVRKSREGEYGEKEERQRWRFGNEKYLETFYRRGKKLKKYVPIQCQQNPTEFSNYFKKDLLGRDCVASGNDLFCFQTSTFITP